MLTVYTVFYNRMTPLKRSVDSLLAALPDDARIVLADDCSTDGTAEALMEYCDGSRVCFFQPPKHFGFTRTLTRAIATHETESDNRFIAIHGAGDRSLPTRFAEQIAALEANAYSFVACRHRLVDEQGRLISKSKPFGEIKEGMLENAPGPWTHGSVMYRASAYFAAGGYAEELTYCQDWDLHIRLLERGKAFVLPAYLYEKVLFSDGASFSPEKRLRQLQYSQLIVSGRLEPRERESTLTRLRKTGIDDSLHADSREISRRIVESILDLASSGQFRTIHAWRSIAREKFAFACRFRIELALSFASFCKTFKLPPIIPHRARVVYIKSRRIAERFAR